MFITLPEKSNLFIKEKFVLPSPTGLRISWNFASMYDRLSRYVGTTIEKGRKVWHREAKQNTWDAIRKPVIISRREAKRNIWYAIHKPVIISRREAKQNIWYVLRKSVIISRREAKQNEIRDNLVKATNLANISNTSYLKNTLSLIYIMSSTCEDNRKRWNICDCSGCYIQSNKSYHIKTKKKHQLFLKVKATLLGKNIINENVGEQLIDYRNKLRRLKKNKTR